MAGAVPGNPKGCPKYGGRVKGTPNKMTTEAKKILTEIISENKEKFQEELAKLSGRDFAIVYLQMCKLILPTQINLGGNAKSAVQQTIEQLNALKK
jgi:hypothetical protein